MKPRRCPWCRSLPALCLTAVVCLTAGWAPTAHADAATDYQYAGGLYQRKLYGLAAQSLSAFLKSNPTDANAAAASYQLAAALYRAPDKDGAIDFAAVAAAYESAMHKFPAAQWLAPARFELADSYFQLKRFDKALATYSAFLKGPPAPEAGQAAEAWYWSAECLVALKRPDEARADYSRVAQSYGNTEIAAYAFYGLGLLEADGGHAVPAAAAFKKVVERYSGSEIAPESRLRLADAQLAAKQWAPAAATYRKVLADNKSAAWKGAALQGVADAAFGARDWAGAGAAYEALLKALAPDAKPRPAAALRLGDSYFNAGNWTAALAAYDGVIKIGDSATTPAALYYSGGALRSLKRPSEAAQRYRRLVGDYAKDPLAARAQLRLGDALADAADAKGAAEAYRVVLTRWPGDAAAKEAQAALVDLAGQVGSSGGAGARSALLAVLRTLPPGAAGSSAQLKLAQAAYARADYKHAATLAAAALGAHTPPAIAENGLYLIASAQLAGGEAGTAATAFERQLKAYPTGPLAGQGRLGLAWAQLDLKKWAAARATASAARSAGGAKIDQPLRLRLALAQAEGAMHSNALAEARSLYGGVAAGSKDAEMVRQARFGLAQCNEAGHQWAAAAALWSQYAAASVDADDKAQAYLRQGQALVKAKSLVAATAAFDRAIAADPPAASPVAAVTRAGASGAGEGGATTPGDSAPGSIAARALYESAWALGDGGRRDEARVRFTRLATNYPDSRYAADALFQSGEIAFAAHQWPEAAALYRQVAQKYKGSANAAAATYQWGAALYNAGQFGAAAGAFDGAAKLGGAAAPSDALFWAGESLRRAGNGAEAIGRYRQFLAMPAVKGTKAPKIAVARALTAAARLGLGQCLAGAGQTTEAIESYKLGLTDAGGAVAAETEFRLGQALAGAGRAAEAAPHFLKVSIAYPTSEWAMQAQWEAAEALAKSGDNLGATELYKALAAHTPPNALSAQAAARLQAASAH